jgi:hypothetical protein
MLIKNKLFAILNDRLIKSYTHGIFPTINYLKLIKLINLIKPYNLGYDLIRVGPSGDGGYLVPDVLKKIKTCFSPGVGNVHGFENDLLERGIKVFMADGTVEKPILLNKNYEFLKKNLGGHEDDKTTTLNSWMDSKETQDDLLLQMDIEGSEYEVVNSLDELNLKKFKVMIIEFHYFEQVLTKMGYKTIESVMKKILKYFDVAHIHPNNCCGSYKVNKTIIPSTLEITFMTKELSLKKDKIHKLPNKLDFKNISHKDDIFLDNSWF